MRLADALDAMKLHVNLLSRAQLCDQDVWIDRLDDVVTLEVFDLPAYGMEGKIPRINMGVVIPFSRVWLIGRRVRILRAFNLQFEDNRVVVHRV